MSLFFVGDICYKKGFPTPLIKCIGHIKAHDAHCKTHEGICGQHLGRKSLAKKILRVGFFWSTKQHDARDYVA